MNAHGVLKFWRHQFSRFATSRWFKPVGHRNVPGRGTFLMMRKTFPANPDRRCTNGLEGGGLEADQGKEKSGPSTDHDLDVIGGRRDQLEDKIQQRYGLAKDQVGKDIDDWYAARRW
jgi:uncharacterized protein YjbJ (UPF0337 family)